MKNIEYYNLDIEYPVNFQFWKDFSAIFVYWGYYKPFKWKGGFRNETTKRIRKAFNDANEKIKNGISFNEYELSKDRLSHNYSSFRYYFERAEKVSSFNFFQKIEWTISQVYKNLYPRISPYNKFCIEVDFYQNAYEIIYNKILIHSYAIGEFGITPLRLAFDPLLIDEKYEEKIKSDILFLQSRTSQSQKSYLLNCEYNLSSSKYFKNIFVDKNIFDKINFSLLKEYDVIYKSTEQGLVFNDRMISDLSFLIIILHSQMIVELPVLKYINNIIFEITNSRCSTTMFTNCRTKYLNPTKLFPSEFDKIAIANIQSFILKYIKNL